MLEEFSKGFVSVLGNFGAQQWELAETVGALDGQPSWILSFAINPQVNVPDCLGWASTQGCRQMGWRFSPDHLPDAIPGRPKSLCWCAMGEGHGTAG